MSIPEFPLFSSAILSSHAISLPSLELFTPSWSEIPHQVNAIGGSRLSSRLASLSSNIPHSRLSQKSGKRAMLCSRHGDVTLSSVVQWERCTLRSCTYPSETKQNTWNQFLQHKHIVVTKVWEYPACVYFFK